MHREAGAHGLKFLIHAAGRRVVTPTQAHGCWTMLNVVGVWTLATVVGVDSGDTYAREAIAGRDGRSTTPRSPRATLASG